MTKVSVVIPYWKGAGYLEDCVRSVEQQEVPCEIILVCDRDHDEIPQSVQDSRLVKILQAEDALPEVLCDGEQRAAVPLGTAFCRNAGLDNADAEYIYFLDSDDYLLAHTLAPMLELAQQKSAQVVTGNQFGSWYSPCNFREDRAVRETDCTQTEPLCGGALRQRFWSRITAQHFLIQRALLDKYGLRFDTRQIRYSDMAFILQVLWCAGDKAWVSADSYYVSRKHNDRIHLPSLSQTEDKNCMEEYLDAYHNSMELIREDQELKTTLNAALIQFVLSHYPGLVTASSLSALQKCFAQMENWSQLVADAPFWQRKMLRAIRARRFRAARVFHKCDVVKKKKKGVLGNRIQWYRVIERLLFRKLPVRRDWVILESFFGRSYSDSPKYLYEYMQKKYGDKYRYIWVLNGRSADLEKTGKHTVCRLESLRYVYYMSRCGYRIFNVRQPSWNKKRDGVVFLETWHGTPLKKLGFDMEDVFSSNPEFKTVFYTQAKEWDYLVSANPFSTDVFARAFGYPRDRILEYGYPRNDILYAADRDETAVRVREELGIPEGKRVILYAPTWRDDQAVSVGQYRFELALDLARMKRELGEDSILLLRTHYYVAQQLDLTGYEGFVYDGSRYEDVSRLYLVSDCLVTDYSSVFFDYANLRRPILFFAYDHESYADEMRGLYIDMEKELPGPVLTTNDELMEALHHIQEVTVQYQSRYDAFYERFCCVDDGKASERIIQAVFK